jgi:flagellar biosynthesis protein FlhG
MDQATTLRQIVGQTRRAGTAPEGAADGAADGATGAPERNPEPTSGRAGRLRVIAVTSGKGGVGKTNLVLNLCIALSRLERRVFLLDADMGLANVDVLLGMSPRYTIEHVLTGQKELRDIVLDGPGGFKVLPASSGISELSELTYDQQMHLFRALSSLDGEMDYLFIDTGAGISSNVLRFNASAHEIVVIASPEPTSITDAYALMKLLSIKYHLRAFSLIANSVTSEEEGQEVFDRLNKVAGQFLNVTLRYLGPVPLDKLVPKAVRLQRPFLQAFPTAPASVAITRIAALLDRTGAPPDPMARLPDSASEAANPASGTSNSAPGGSNTSPGTPPEGSFWDRLLHWKKVK